MPVTSAGEATGDRAVCNWLGPRGRVWLPVRSLAATANMRASNHLSTLCGHRRWIPTTTAWVVFVRHRHSDERHAPRRFTCQQRIYVCHISMASQSRSAERSEGNGGDLTLIRTHATNMDFPPTRHQHFYCWFCTVCSRTFRVFYTILDSFITY